MQFEEDEAMLKIGEHAGFLLACVLFFSISFFVFSYFEKIPSWITYAEILILALILVLIHIWRRKQ